MNAWQWLVNTHPHLLAFHVPNGEKRGRRTAGKLKRMGVRAGVGDFLLFPQRNVMVCVELKRSDGSQSEDQEQFEKQWKRVGGSYHLVKTLEDFQAIVTGYYVGSLTGVMRDTPKVPWA